jgi:hypothetical protein
MLHGLHDFSVAENSSNKAVKNMLHGCGHNQIADTAMMIRLKKTKNLNGKLGKKKKNKQEKQGKRRKESKKRQQGCNHHQADEGAPTTITTTTIIIVIND